MKGMKRGLTIGQKIRFAFYVTAAVALGITVPFAAAVSGAAFVGFALLGAFMPLAFGYITESALAVATEKKRNRAEEEMLEESNNNFKKLFHSYLLLQTMIVDFLYNISKLCLYDFYLVP